MINIILADDHNLVRNGIKALLDREPLCKIVGEADDGATVLALLKQGIIADIVLTDISMQGMGGLELVESLKTSHPEIKSVVLSVHDNEQYVTKAFRMGAIGYLLKSIGADELIFAIKHISQNNQYVSSQLSTKFLDRLLTIPDQIPNLSKRGIEFSEKELEILSLIADGYTNQEIADKTYSGKRTIEGYRQGLIDKTGARNTAALVRFAMANGIIN
ncbi:response regulator transcription factor [Mucilaginibacter sp. ZT4R22]|uniref:Response regulator transcription factor n=1 Tax=Mucilaginibacter pankratovii TaxID=2772110 RepID=A0ABR7WL52_9SPHI|nr:response regulator transcription factor [Mucilaginibacter pankratovii]MBD1363058.1 response regulator transcription factor [Mucilaginibacter pankratovii]